MAEFLTIRNKQNEWMTRVSVHLKEELLFFNDDWIIKVELTGGKGRRTSLCY